MKSSVVLLNIILALTASLTWASSHSESPQTAAAPGADISDLYLFRSYETGKEDTVTMIMNVLPLEDPFAGPNYYGFSPAHFYQFVIHQSSCASEDHVFSFYFGSAFGGKNGTVSMYDDSDFCKHTLNETFITSPLGLTVPIRNSSGSQIAEQYVPLKFIGGYSESTPTAWAGLNSFPIFSLDYATKLGTFPRQNLATGKKIPMTNVGTKTFPGNSYATYLANGGNGIGNSFVHQIDLGSFCSGRTARVFAGPRSESFSVNLGNIFDLVNMVPIPGFPGQSVKDDPANNRLSGKNVQTIAMEIPISCFSSSNIGVWATTRELYHNVTFSATAHFEGIQFSRLGNPLVNEVVIGLKDKQRFNVNKPAQDAPFVTYVQNPSLPAILNELFLSFVQSNVAGMSGTQNIAPKTPRNDLMAIFINGIPNLNGFVSGCEMLRLNTTYAPKAAASQSNMGVFGLDTAGFPNGRRPGDDVVDIALQAVMGRVCTACSTFTSALGVDICSVCGPSDAPVGSVNFLDGAPQSASQFMSTFPYLMPPHVGSSSNVVEPATTTSTTGAVTAGASAASQLDCILF